MFVLLYGWDRRSPQPNPKGRHPVAVKELEAVQEPSAGRGTVFAASRDLGH